MMNDLSHFDSEGAARMVNVSAKASTHRVAVASAMVIAEADTIIRIQSGNTKKGDVLGIARTAGIMAAKKTDQLIPLCHTLPLESVGIDFEFPSETALRIVVTAETTAKTGVEMEAMTAASICALTVYDMCKAIDRSMTIASIQLERKSGGKSGVYQRDA